MSGNSVTKRSAALLLGLSLATLAALGVAAQDRVPNLLPEEALELLGNAIECAPPPEELVLESTNETRRIHIGGAFAGTRAWFSGSLEHNMQDYDPSRNETRRASITYSSVAHFAELGIASASTDERGRYHFGAQCSLARPCVRHTAQSHDNSMEIAAEWHYGTWIGGEVCDLQSAEGAAAAVNALVGWSRLVPPNDAELLGFELEPDGLSVSAVAAHTPADLSGLRVGDELLSVGGKPVADEFDVVAQLAISRVAFDETSVGVRRDGSEKRLVLGHLLPDPFHWPDVEERETFDRFASRYNLTEGEVVSAFAATGMVSCGGRERVGHILGKNDVVLTLGDIFHDSSSESCDRVEPQCFFYRPQVDGGKMHHLDMSTVQTGGEHICAGFQSQNWAVARLVDKVDVEPYRARFMSGQSLGRSDLLLSVSHRDADLAKGSIQECHHQNHLSQKARYFSDCSQVGGHDGNGLFLVKAADLSRGLLRPDLVAIDVGYIGNGGPYDPKEFRRPNLGVSNYFEGPLIDAIRSIVETGVGDPAPK